jgi:predicted mannosyl-3-phosphoglycerate phosphatase (HAD superfamily)
MQPVTIFVDFDGTIVEHQYPKIGPVAPHAIRVLRRLQDANHLLVLNTYRADARNGTLDKAVSFLADTWRTGKTDLKSFHAIMASKAQPASFFLHGKLQIHNDRTVGGVIYLDDQAIGMPTIFASSNKNKVVDWLEVEKILEEYHLFEPADTTKLSTSLYE